MIGNWHPFTNNHLQYIMDEKKISNSSWQESLTKLIHARNQTPDKPIAIVGMGQPLKGDDSIGIMIIEKLEKAGHTSKFLLINTGAVPENCTGILRRHQTELVIFIDAADISAQPGEIRLLHYSQMESDSIATHSIPFGMLCQYLVKEIGCDIWVLGIQPAQNNFLASISPEVDHAARTIVEWFTNFQVNI